MCQKHNNCKKHRNNVNQGGERPLQWKLKDTREI